MAQLALSDITGEFSADDLLGEILGGFVLGSERGQASHTNAAQRQTAPATRQRVRDVKKTLPAGLPAGQCFRADPSLQIKPICVHHLHPGGDKSCTNRLRWSSWAYTSAQARSTN